MEDIGNAHMHSQNLEDDNTLPKKLMTKRYIPNIDRGPCVKSDYYAADILWGEMLPAGVQHMHTHMHILSLSLSLYIYIYIYAYTHIDIFTHNIRTW